MSLRSLGSLLTRRLSPLGIPRAQPQAEPSPGTGGGTQAARGSAAGRSALSLRTLLAPRGAAVAAVALAGTTLAILYLKDDDTGSAGTVIGEEIMNEVTDKKKPVNEVHEVVVVDQEVISEVCDDDKSKLEAAPITDSEPDVKKQDMKERFEEWAKKYDKKYRDEEERAMRFEVFKATAEFVDARSPSDQKRFPLGTNFLADWTKEERRRLLACPNGISVEGAREMARTFPSISKEFKERRAAERRSRTLQVTA